MAHISLSEQAVRAAFDPYVMDNGVLNTYLSAYGEQLQAASRENQLKLPVLPKFLAPREYTPKQIIHNPNAVIVFWKDNTKTIVRRREGDTDDIHSAFSQALAKKMFGATTTVHKMVDKVLKEQLPKRKE